MMREWAQFKKCDMKHLYALMDTSMEEFKWLSLAAKGVINPLTFPITSVALLRFQKKTNMCGPSTNYVPMNARGATTAPSNLSYQMIPTSDVHAATIKMPPIKKRRIVDYSNESSYPYSKRKDGPHALLSVFPSSKRLGTTFKTQTTTHPSDPGVESEDEEEQAKKTTSLDRLAVLASEM
jgi:hypothetical protein